MGNKAQFIIVKCLQVNIYLGVDLNQFNTVDNNYSSPYFMNSNIHKRGNYLMYKNYLGS